MADFKFSCPHCTISVECDELWCGHEIQCPSCHKEFVVPQKPAGPPHASLASAKQGQPKLSIGTSQAQHSSSTKAVAPQAAALEHKLQQAKSGQRSPVMKWVTVGIVVVVLAVGGVFAYGPAKDWLAKRAEAKRLASAPPPPTNAAPAEPEPPPPPKELPVLPAVWTLDVAQANIPEGKANGSISGTNFIVESALCTPQLLSLYEGAARSPDRALMVYLNLKPGESLTNRTFTVSSDARSKDVRQVMKLWKTNPRFAAHTKAFSTGYAMKLELGQLTSNMISGKIFLALPDPEQSVVAGQFRAMTALLPGSPAGGAAPAAAAAAPSRAVDPAFEKRYGKKH
jgi:hypothetical protein